VDNDICGAAYRLMDGVFTDAPALAKEIITKVGPGGHFLAERHTRENLRKEQFMPSDVIDRLTPESWKKGGSKETTNRAKETVDKLLEEHIPAPLPRDAEGRLDEVFKGILKRHGITMSRIPLEI
jgi:trimethylamine--corrinoid protein Co-methyltransferase